MIRRTASAVLLTVIFASCSSTAPTQLNENQAPRSRYSGQAGESPVGVIPEGTVRDAQRGQDVVFTVEYPTRPGPHPLVIFSHGFGATRLTYVGLSSHWASQGYVVIKPAHADSGRLKLSDPVEAWRNQTQTDWRNRVRDVTAIIDGLDKIEESYPELQGKIDRTKIGVGGHSYGAFTAMLVGGAKTFPEATSYADPRVKSIVVLSPQGPSETFHLTAESFKEIGVPSLFMTGTRDRGLNDNETPEWRRLAFDNAAAGDKWLIVLEGAHHGSFTGQIGAIAPAATEVRTPIINDPTNPLPQPTAPVQQPYERGRPREGSEGLRIRGTFANVKAMSLAFWDAYLKGDAEGRTTLENASNRGGIELVKK
jgi:predicted dienelactone hydrolase